MFFLSFINSINQEILKNYYLKIVNILVKINNKKVLKFNCLRCEATINVKYVEAERHYSQKNNWDYWTESKVDKKAPRYICDNCLIELYYRYKKEFKNLIKNEKKRNLLGVYINEGIIGVRRPFFLPK